MDWTLLDITDLAHVAIDDDVFLIGGESGTAVTAADLARETGTISYEITCGIAPRVARVYQ
jgi:alanine racemase